MLPAPTAGRRSACLQRSGRRHRRGAATPSLLMGRGLHGFRSPSGPLDAGNSGTTMRMLAGVLAAQPFTRELVGDESLSRRPMRRVIEPLALMGARIEATDGHAPLDVHGTTLHADCLPPAGAERAGEERGAPRRPARRRHHVGHRARPDPRSHRAGARGVRLRRRRRRPDGVDSTAASAAAASAAGAGRLLVGGVLDGRGRGAARLAQSTIEDVGLNPTRTGAHRRAAPVRRARRRSRRRAGAGRRTAAARSS